MKGLERMLRTLMMIGRAKHPVPEYTILPTMFDRRTSASLTSLRMLKEQYPADLSNTVIPVDTQFRDASRMGVPLTIRSPGDRGSLAYGKLLAELLAVDNQALTSAGSSL